MGQLFDELLVSGESAIEELVQTKQQENVQLEFKRKANNQSGELDKSDRENFAKILSGFSNSAGGLMVWGVDARKNPTTGVDEASTLLPIAEIRRFKTDVLRLVSQCIIPKHEGIRVEAIESKKNPGAGFLLVDVERSERRPHRAEIGDRAYYKRVGDSFIAMEHYDIEDAFRRMSVAELTADVNFERDGQNRGPGPRDNANLMRCILTLTNTSTQTAQFPYLAITGGHIAKLLTYGFSDEAHEGWVTFSANPDIVIHPGTTRRVAGWIHRIPVVTDLAGGDAINRQNVQPYTVPYRLGCRNSPMKTGALEIDLLRGCRELYSSTQLI